jgi:hypothetical protein
MSAVLSTVMSTVMGTVMSTVVRYSDEVQFARGLGGVFDMVAVNCEL